MSETLPQIRARHASEIRDLIRDYAQAGNTQKQTADALNVTPQIINQICQRENIFFRVKWARAGKTQ